MSVRPAVRQAVRLAAAPPFERRGAGAAPALPRLPLGTPVVFEGSSSVALGYQPTGYAKLMLAELGGALMPAPGGWIAYQGSTVSGTGTHTMLKRRATALARISEMVAAYGRCVVWTQCGNGTGTGGVSIAQSVEDFAGLVRDYQAAGATVFGCTVPPFAATYDAWALAMNAWITGAGVLDGFIDTTPVLNASHTVDGTHLNAAGIRLVGQMAANMLRARIAPGDGYAGPGVPVWADDFVGTAGSKGSSGAEGELATGWAMTKVGGDGSAVVAKKPDGAGGEVQVVTVTAAAGTSPLRFLLERTVAAPVPTGALSDALLTVNIVAGAMEGYWRINDGSGPFWPANATTYAAFEAEAWAGRPLVWRGYSAGPVAAGWSQTKFQIYMRAQAGQSFTAELSRLRVWSRMAGGA